MSAKDEPIGNDPKDEKSYKTKEGMTLTEAEVRQRTLAGLQTELVETTV